jgi:hypothetical protein
MQNAPPEALIGYTSVLLRAVEHRLLRYLHDRFEERISVELKQPSPFRKEILKWCEKSKDEVDNKKALFPIMEALTARTIEIAMVENVANKAAKLYPDDELAKVVDTVCAMSKPFAINFLGLFEINSSGGFDHVRKNLIDINNRRIAGHLRANTDTLFSDIDDLRQYVKILLIAHDKLYEQLEATQINQNSMMCDKLLEVQKKNEAFQKLAGELSNQLEQALADNAKISNLTVTIDQLRKDLLGRDSEIRKLTIQLKDERQARQKAEAEVEYLQSKLVEQQKSHGAELKVVHDSFGAILQEERRKSEAALQEERCKFEAALQKERAQSKVALEQQRLHYQALLAQQSVQLGAVSLQEVVADEAGMITPKKAQSSLVATKSRFNYSTGGNETDETAFGPTAFGATFSPGGPVDDQ